MSFDVLQNDAESNFVYQGLYLNKKKRQQLTEFGKLFRLVITLRNKLCVSEKNVW